MMPIGSRSSARCAGPGAVRISVPPGLRMRLVSAWSRGPKTLRISAAEASASGRDCHASAPMAAALGCARAARRSAGGDRSTQRPGWPGSASMTCAR